MMKYPLSMRGLITLILKNHKVDVQFLEAPKITRHTLFTLLCDSVYDNTIAEEEIGKKGAKE